MKRIFSITGFLIFILSMLLIQRQVDYGIPITGSNPPDLPNTEEGQHGFKDTDNFEELLNSYLQDFEIPLIAFDTFLKNSQRGDTVNPAGVYADDVFAYEIVQQPYGSISFVPTAPDQVSQFGLAKEFGSIGLLGHNYLAGNKFFVLELGDTIKLIFANGEFQEYKVIEIRRFQALTPGSVYSSFRDMADGEFYTSTSLFELIYGRPDHLIFQVCITEGGNYNWGRHFVIAEPIE